MNVIISGASGLIGSAVSAALRSAGHRVIALVRRPARGDDEVAWDPHHGTTELRTDAPIDAAIHLAGESIAARRWSEAQKHEIRDSRVLGTRTLVRALLALERRPAVLLTASAVGFYGCRGDEELDEGSAMGEGFLAETCRDWEAETRDAVRAGVRAAQMRLGLVLAREGGALPRIALPFRLGLGGKMGSGRQWWSWIALEDVVGAMLLALEHDGLRGPVNVVAPEPVTNAEFSRTLARVLRRPALLPAPAFALRLVLGEMADGMILCSARVRPRHLTGAGYVFRHPTLESALRAALSK